MERNHEHDVMKHGHHEQRNMGYDQGISGGVVSGYQVYWGSKYSDWRDIISTLRRLRSDLLNPKFGRQKSALL